MKDDRIRKLYKQYLGGLEPWQIKLAMSRLRYYAVPIGAWEDAMQELAIVVIEFCYDPEKAGEASERTALCRRLDQRIKMMARKRVRAYDFERRLREMANRSREEYTPDMAAADAEVRDAVAELTPEQQEICEDLAAGLTVSQIAKAAGRDWHTIERQVAKIREHIEKRGLEL